MKKPMRNFILLCLVAVMIGLVFVEASEAARWRYHAFRRGWVTVWGTRNCRRVTRPLVYRRYMRRCQRIGGWLPWWCNDWLVRHEWGWPCYNITWRKYYVRPCWCCWWNRWRLFPIYEWMEDWVPNQYSLDGIIVPSLGDPDGHLSGNQEIFIMVNLSDWTEEGMPFYEPLTTGEDPNDRVYMFTGGACPDLPGFMAFRLEPGMNPDEVVEFDPQNTGGPWHILRNDLLLEGELSLLSEENMDSVPYDGDVMAGDNNWDGRVNLADFSRSADVWLQDGIIRPFCGNGVCEPMLGENSRTCPEDCPGGIACDHDGICEPWEDPAACLDCVVPWEP